MSAIQEGKCAYKLGSSGEFRIYESGDVTDLTGSFTVTYDQLVVEDNDDLDAWLATNPAVGDVTPWGNTRDLPVRRIA